MKVLDSDIVVSYLQEVLKVNVKWGC